MSFDVRYIINKRIRKLLKQHEFIAVINRGPLYMIKCTRMIRYDADFIDKDTGEFMCYMEYKSGSRIKKDLKWITEVMGIMEYPKDFKIVA